MLCHVISQILLQQLVADLLAVLLTSPQQVGNFLVYGEVTGSVCNGFWALAASAFNQLRWYSNSPGHRAYCYAELAVFSQEIAITIASTHVVYTRRDDQAELASVAWLNTKTWARGAVRPFWMAPGLTSLHCISARLVVSFSCLMFFNP